MGEKTDNKLLAAINSHSHKKVRMAYSLNDTQPVLCTMVSDQPFFYIDEEMSDEDDFFLSDDLMFDDALLEESLDHETSDDHALVDELLSMKNKIDAYNNVADICNIEKSDALEIFKEDAKASFNIQAQVESCSVEDVVT